MADEYTPTTEQVREAASLNGAIAIEPDAFNRWLAARDRATVQAETLAAWKAANATVVEAVALLGGTFGESLREVLAVDPKGADRG